MPPYAAQPLLGGSDQTALEDRYQVDRVLGKGGMGEVLTVVERATGKRFALKRLLPGAKPKHVSLLQREFHTLVSLQHPNVVQAFDFGTSGGVPYYTMELLAGGEVERLAPLPWTEVVPILRAVASALSLLHARQLAHRDVSARNVWRTPDGNVKLIDFGTLANFGEAKDISGTPPFVAPEALRSHVIDQRSDLFSLGALAYFLLTGRHAFAARSLSELEQYWTKGYEPPGALLAQLSRADLPALPELFEQLLYALLSLEPDGRPASAAEVLDRLATIMPLPGADDSTKASIDAVLASKAFVGRQSERSRLRELLKQTLERGGTGAALLGPQGIGRSRLLAEIAIEARVSGATVLALAGDGERTAFAAVGRALTHLLNVMPAEARPIAARHAAVLGHISAQVRAALAMESKDLEQFPAMAGEGRMRVQSALHSVWLGVSQAAPVVLLLDDLQSMDEASVALFAALAREAGNSRLLLIAAVQTENEATVPESAKAFVERASVLGLSGLRSEECQEMLRSIFGDVDHLPRTAAVLSERAEGNPGRLMELCGYLARTRRIQYRDGSWVLPQEAAKLAVPGTWAQLDEAKLEEISDDARSMARVLSIVQGVVSLDLCTALSPVGPESTFSALAELCVTGILTGADNGYRFRREAIRAALCEKLDEEDRVYAHRVVGEVMLATEPASGLQRLTAGVHLLRGGRTEQGAEIVAKAAANLVKDMPEETAEFARQLEQAYPLMRELQLNDHQLHPVLSALAILGFFADRRLGFEHGAEALACAQRVCGMNLARRLSPWLGKKLGLFLALAYAATRCRRAAKESPMVPDFEHAVRLMLTCAASLAGMYAICVDRAKVLESARAIEPIAALGENHVSSIVYRFAVGCAGTIGWHLEHTRRHWQRLMARLDDPKPIKGMDPTLRAYYAAASLYNWGMSECWRDNSQALDIAQRLEQQPLRLYRVSADQLRAVYNSHQGRLRAAAASRARVEMHALQRGVTWQVELWEPSAAATVGARQYDAMLVKRAAGQLAKLTVDTPSLRNREGMARGLYLLLRGRHREALELMRKVIEEMEPALLVYANAIAQLAQAHNGVEEFAQAREVCMRTLGQIAPEDLEFPALTLRLQIELALAESGLGNHVLAGTQLDALLARHAANEGPLTLGALHDARASVALRAGDEALAQSHVQAMERWYRGTECPSLIQHCNRIARRWAKRTHNDGVPYLPGLNFLDHISTKLTSTVLHEPADAILAQVVRGAVAAEGVLVVQSAAGPSSVFKSRADALPSGLLAWLEERMGAAFADSTQTDELDGSPTGSPNEISIEGKRWRVFMLATAFEAARGDVGAVALCNTLTQIPPDVLEALAKYVQGGGWRVTASLSGHSKMERRLEDGSPRANSE